jgi:hypothetical protein
MDIDVDHLKPGQHFEMLTRKAQTLLDDAMDILDEAAKNFLRCAPYTPNPAVRAIRKRKFTEDFITINGAHLDPKIIGLTGRLGQHLAHMFYTPHQRHHDDLKQSRSWPHDKMLAWFDGAGRYAECWGTGDVGDLTGIVRADLLLDLMATCERSGQDPDVFFRMVECLDTLIMSPLLFYQVVSPHIMHAVTDASLPAHKIGYRIRLLAYALLYNLQNAEKKLSLRQLVAMVPSTDSGGPFRAEKVEDDAELRLMSDIVGDLMKSVAQCTKRFCLDSEKRPTIYGICSDMMRTTLQPDRDDRDVMRVLCLTLALVGHNSEESMGCAQLDTGIHWGWPDKKTTAAGVLCVGRHRLDRKDKWGPSMALGTGLGFEEVQPVAKRIHARTCCYPVTSRPKWWETATRFLDVSKLAWSAVRLTKEEAYRYDALNYSEADSEPPEGSNHVTFDRYRCGYVFYRDHVQEEPEANVPK